MKINKKLENRPFFSEFESPITEKHHIYYKISSKIFERNNIDKDIKYVLPLKTCFDYDSFVVSCEEKDYILKISLDATNNAIVSESLFYRNNKDLSICSLVDCGVIKIGDEISFLLVENDLGFDLYDLGASYVLDNLFGFFVTFMNQRKFVSDQSVEDYIDKLINEVDINKLSESSKSDIKVYQDLDHLCRVLDDITSNLLKLKSKELFKSYDFCHGGLDFDNLTSLDGLFKFCNYENSFYGNQIIDLSIMNLNIGYQERDFNYVCRQYCKINGLDYEAKKTEIRECLELSCNIHLCKLIYSFVIEQCVYKNSREDRITYLVRNFFETSWCLDISGSSTWVIEFLNEMFSIPVDFDKELREKYSE